MHFSPKSLTQILRKRGVVLPLKWRKKLSRIILLLRVRREHVNLPLKNIKWSNFSIEESKAANLFCAKRPSTLCYDESALFWRRRDEIWNVGDVGLLMIPIHLFVTRGKSCLPRNIFLGHCRLKHLEKSRASRRKTIPARRASTK